MTGYAVATSEGAAGTLTIEIKSVNSRFLDLQFRINDDLRALEPDLRAAIMAAITRGKVEVRVSFGRKVAGGAAGAQSGTAGRPGPAARRSGAHFAQAAPMTVAELLRWPGVIEEATIGQESLQADVAALTVTTMAAFVDSRRREGAALETMLQSRIESMEAIVKRITPLIPQVISQFQQQGHRAHAGRAGPGRSRQSVDAHAPGSVRADSPGSDPVRHPDRRRRKNCRACRRT